jgi:hypothetical protein
MMHELLMTSLDSPLVCIPVAHFAAITSAASSLPVPAPNSVKEAERIGHCIIESAILINRTAAE